MGFPDQSEGVRFEYEGVRLVLEGDMRLRNPVYIPKRSKHSYPGRL